MNKTVAIVIGVVVTVGIIGGLLSLGGSSDLQSLTEQAASQRDAAPKTETPDFTLQSLEGGAITFADYKGEKPVILDFWATWCPNCRRDMPKLSALYEKYGDQVEVIAVNSRESKSLVSNFVDNLSLKFPVVFDTNGSVAQQYGITYTSTKVFIDKEGIIQDTFPADVTGADFQELLATEEKSPAPLEPQTPQT